MVYPTGGPRRLDAASRRDPLDGRSGLRPTVEGDLERALPVVVGWATAAADELRSCSSFVSVTLLGASTSCFGVEDGVRVPCSTLAGVDSAPDPAAATGSWGGGSLTGIIALSTAASSGFVVSGGGSTVTEKTSPPNSSPPPPNGSSSAGRFRSGKLLRRVINTPFSASPSRTGAVPPFTVVSTNSSSSSSSTGCSISCSFSKTPLTNWSAARRRPALGMRSSGLTPSWPVRGHRNPPCVRASRMQDSQVVRPSWSHGKIMASLTTL